MVPFLRATACPASAANAAQIGDFGLACKLLYDGERKNTVCGTPNYIAPEVLSSQQGHIRSISIFPLGKGRC